MNTNIPKDVTLEDVIKCVKGYYGDADVAFIEKAYEFSNSRHQGQKRSSGEDYIMHPLSVAYILARLRLDLPSIVTGILHDTVEDTTASKEEIKREFGEEVSFLVDGVTKLGKLKFRSSHEKQAENFRKMLLAMAKDLRVILVKLADRTHNMRTLTHLAPHKQQKIAQETLDIYAPLANRLGISWMKLELEDLGLKYSKPSIYSKISALVDTKKAEREEYIQKLIKIIMDQVAKYGLNVKVVGRAKHFYSIFKKMESRGVNFEDIQDIVAFRVVTKSISECYEVLGIIHSFFKPVPGRFKDYIAMPKKNLYQSLHTTVIGPFGERLEVQIRTNDMHRVAESGIAAHWKYKSGKLDDSDAKKFRWLRQLVDTQESTDNPSEFLDSVKLDLFMGDIYVFTPKGELLEFPAGSTPLDFAYTIHTDLGHKCTGAKVNGRIVPLKHKLRSGDTIDIISSNTQRPNKDWLKIVKTGRAKSKIRQYIRSEERDRARVLGRELLDREFRRYGKSLPKFEKQKDLESIIQKLSFASFEEMLINLGYGKKLPNQVIHWIFPELKSVEEEPEQSPSSMSEIFKNARDNQKKKSKSPVKIAGMDEDILVRFGKCCHPLPGDEIAGYISRGRGITIHKIDCRKTLDLDVNRSIDVEWDVKENTTLRSVKIKVLCLDKPGVLNHMSQTITNTGININSVNIRVNADKRATGIFDLQVRDRAQLQNCIHNLETVDGVIAVERI
ncbi:bifunctional (p)ppGpp synthetase/guanosine-3',5'-bis(diphosphate) 3'-pyrophosphohydrolase [bacterium]|nr:bifunctional (p)ppGpp synthetase/guanosine-3',5'-bis(diphosphate) 3'-pyrophosphohydrolase [bacterium]